MFGEHRAKQWQRTNAEAQRERIASGQQAGEDVDASDIEQSRAVFAFLAKDDTRSNHDAHSRDRTADMTIDNATMISICLFV